MALIVCRERPLPIERTEAAARRAIEVNPENARERRRVARTPTGVRGGPSRIAVLVGRKWPKTGVRLSASFMDRPSRELRTRILLHMNAWGETANVVFTETEGAGQVRIARLDTPTDMAGYWSYIGTEVLEIPEDEPTLNLEAFTMRTPEREFRRVVRHEAGHTLGFEHEHMREDIVKRIDRAKALKFFDLTQGWTEQEVDEQVLTPLKKKSLMGTLESDPLSIMCYQLPARIMKDRKAVPGGENINARDASFAASIYPQPSPAHATTTPAPPATAPAVFPVRRPTANEDTDTFHLILMDDFRVANNGRRAEGQPPPATAQVLASYGGARVTGVMRLRAAKGEKPTNFGRIIAAHTNLKKYTNRTGGVLPTEEHLIRFGGELFDTLFEGDVKRLYDEARSRQHRRLDFVLTSMIPWISEKPWEFAYDTSRASFLATEEIHFIRNVLTNVPADPIVRPDGPLRILVAAAQPVGFGLLSVDQEVEVIRRGFTPLVDAKLASVEVVPRVTPEQLHGYLRSGSYQIAHFIGHGVFDETRREGCLVFENERGGEYLLGERQARELFCKRGLSLVFLNACETGRGGRVDFNKGVAQSLVAHGLPALVANQYSVLDSSATTFAQHFYGTLAQGLPIGEAAREARIAVNYSLHGELIDWAVPVLYARNPGMTITDPRPDRPAAPFVASRRARAAVIKRDVRVAVWDVDGVFPGIERTLHAMSDAQSVFGFSLADLSVPLDVWDIDKQEGVNFLWAERIAHRLRGAAANLGVDLLACVTRHWLRDDDWLYLYGWWPDGHQPPVTLLSVAGFPELEAEGPQTDRVIANAMVTCLAGFYGDTGTHERGSKDCPMFFNRERSYTHLVGRQRFDAECRRKLKGPLGAKLPALTHLLSAFDANEQ